MTVRRKWSVKTPDPKGVHRVKREGGLERVVAKREARIKAENGEGGKRMRRKSKKRKK